MFNYFNYSLIFFKLWGLNKILFGIPYYLIEHIILQNILHITYQGSKMLIIGIGNGVYNITFPKPIEILENNYNKNRYNENRYNENRYNINI